MGLKKNITSQYVALYAFDATDHTPVTGDAANISTFVSKDAAAEAASANSVSELDATNCPGVYLLQLSQAETNADLVIVTGTSTTANVEMEPVIIHTDQWTFDGLDWDNLIEAVIATLFGVAERSATGVVFKKRDGSTTKVAITHDSQGNRTVSTVTA